MGVMGALQCRKLRGKDSSEARAKYIAQASDSECPLANFTLLVIVDG